MNTQWKMVPVEPTQSILDAMTTERKKGNGVLQMWFEAMAAAPAPPNAEASEASAAIATLQHLGYAYCGGEHWKPPIGKKPDFDLINTLRAERDALQLRLNAADQALDEADDGFSLLSLEAGRRMDLLEGLLRGWLDLFPKQGVTGGPITTQKERTVAALKPLSIEPDHQIPGTSGMRLNMLANQGE